MRSVSGIRAYFFYRDTVQGAAATAGFMSAIPMREADGLHESPHSTAAGRHSANAHDICCW
jgi:hypothetical protein